MAKRKRKVKDLIQAIAKCNMDDEVRFYVEVHSKVKGTTSTIVTYFSNSDEFIAALRK